MMTWFTSQLLLWPIVVPLLASALCAVVWTHPKVQRWISMAATVVMATVSLALVAEVMRQNLLVMTFGGWPAPFGISFVADRLGAAMVAITGILALAVGVFGLGDIRRRQEHAGFYPLVQGLLASVNGAFLTGDIFNLYVWFEIMLITAMGLLLIDRTRAQLDGALKYVVLNLFSTMLFLMAIAIVYGVTGTLNMADLARVLPGMEETAALALAAVLFLVSFGIKAGYFPFFFWLPASYHTASITVAAIFAGLLTKVGVYASFRVFSLLFQNGAGLRDVIAVMAAGTMLFGVFGAAVQWDIRRILSFHIISQIGYMLLGLALGTPQAIAGAIFYIFHHIIVKANLFLVAGAIHRATGTYDLRKAGGLMSSHPLLACLFAVPALALAGIPPLSGFWAKYMVINASFQAKSNWLAAVGLFVGLLTVFSMSKIWIEAFWKSPPPLRPAQRSVPCLLLVPIAMLGLLTLWIGLQPESLVRYATAAADALLNPQAYVGAVLGGSGASGGVP
jgi:multicomponent Na+:H+ antiporter subunit D